MISVIILVPPGFFNPYAELRSDIRADRLVVTDAKNCVAASSFGKAGKNAFRDKLAPNLEYPLNYCYSLLLTMSLIASRGSPRRKAARTACSLGVNSLT